MTSSSVVIYAYKNESGNLMIITWGMSKMNNSTYGSCRPPVFILQEDLSGGCKKSFVHQLSMMSLSPICNHIDEKINTSTIATPPTMTPGLRDALSKCNASS
jgi:hypothetical protein